jgi:hypothetical protein
MKAGIGSPEGSVPERYISSPSLIISDFGRSAGGVAAWLGAAQRRVKKRKRNRIIMVNTSYREKIHIS